MAPSATPIESTPYGVAKERETKKSTTVSKEHDIVLKTFRLLVADLCQQFGGGHPGGAIGMAAIGVALWKYVMKYAPHTPDYFNRDRFVLSNGAALLCFQYCFLHLTGYKNMTSDQLRSYHSDRVNALCPGHPEIEHEGIELTTGPLGQGVANAVGLAIASKHLGATYNRPGFEVVNNHTWCMTGDACLQEGVALEAISLAGHLRLDNLTLMYDNNQVTCDGSVDLTNTEDVNAKMRDCGWEIIDIEDGCFDIPALIDALRRSRELKCGKPVFINIRTIIGVGSAVAGDAVAHGAAFGKENVSAMKIAYGFNPDEQFVVGDEVKQFFEDIPARGQKQVEEWNDLLMGYSDEHPALAAEFRQRMKEKLPSNWKDNIPSSFPLSATPSRKSAGLAFNPVAKAVNSFMVGTADLSPSVNMTWPGKVVFQHPNRKTTCGINGNYTGRYIHFGIREHAQRSVLRRYDGVPAIGVEAYSSLGWERWADASFSMKSFGHSLPGSASYKHFGFTPEQMAVKVVDYLENIRSGHLLRGEFVEL